MDVKTILNMCRLQDTTIFESDYTRKPNADTPIDTPRARAERIERYRKLAEQRLPLR